MEHAGWNRNNKRGTKVKKEHRGQVQRPSHPLSSIFARLFAAVGSFADLTAHLTFRFVVPVPFFFLSLSLFFSTQYNAYNRVKTLSSPDPSFLSITIASNCDAYGGGHYRNRVSTAPTRSISTHFICTLALFHLIEFPHFFQLQPIDRQIGFAPNPSKILPISGYWPGNLDGRSFDFDKPASFYFFIINFL